MLETFAPLLGGGIEQDLQKIRCPRIGIGPKGLDQVELRFRIAGARRDHGTAERPCTRIHQEAARGHVVGEGVEHHVARTQTHGMETARGRATGRPRVPRARRSAPVR